MSDKFKNDVITMRYIAGLLSSLQNSSRVPERPTGVTLRDVYRVARQHSLSSAVWQAIGEEVLASGDEPLIAHLSREGEIEIAKHAVQTAEYSRIQSAFTAAGIRYLPMKGFLLKSLWRHPECRSMADLDIFVGKEGADAAYEVLTSLGYTAVERGGNVHDSYEKKPYLKVEIHTSLYLGAKEGFDDWQLSRDNEYRYEMSPTDFLFFMLTHMYKHYNEGGIGARTVFDMHLYILKNGESIDTHRLGAMLRRDGLTDFYGMLLSLAELWFSGEPTEPTAELLDFERFVVIGGSYGNFDNRVRKRQSRFRYALYRIFPPYREMKYIYKWLAKMPILLPAAYVIRIVRAIFKGGVKREITGLRNFEKDK
ncbi:MAG: nucleotidyltransferase family protein [Clostridia bacterium]|nr:nucleotidyltransferase family protein [Clostridia bacterium]